MQITRFQIDQDIKERTLKKQKFLAVFCINGIAQWCEIPFFNSFVRDWDSTGHCPLTYIEDFIKEGKEVVYYNL